MNSSRLRFSVMAVAALCLRAGVALVWFALASSAQAQTCSASSGAGALHMSGGGLLSNLLGPLAGGASASASGEYGACAPGEPASVSLEGPGTVAGNPVDVLSGAKLERALDAHVASASAAAFRQDDMAPLVVSRFHVTGPSSSSALGPGWRLGLEARLHASPSNRGLSLQVIQGDGRVVRFGKRRRVQSGAVHHEALIRTDGVLQLVDDAQLPWRWHWRSGRQLAFDDQGRLRRIHSPAAASLLLAYDARGRLVEVASSDGRAIGFRYHAGPRSAFPDRLSELRLPGAGRVRYSYDAVGRLVQVALADGSRIGYRYVDGHSGRLAGVVRSGAGASEYRYDAFGRTVYSRPAGAPQTQALYFDYGADPGAQSGQTTVRINGQLRARYRWQRVGPMLMPALVHASGPGCDSCPQTGVAWRYDALGRLRDMRSVPGAQIGQSAESMRFERDELGRIIGVRWRRAHQERWLRVGWRSYDAFDAFESLEWPSVIPGRNARLLARRSAQGALLLLEQQGFSPVVTLADGGLPQVAVEPLRRELRDPALLVGALAVKGGQTRHDAGRLWRDDFGRAVAQWSADSGLVRRRFDAADRLVAEWRADGSRAWYDYDATGLLATTRVQRASPHPAGLDVGTESVRLRWQGRQVASIDGPGQRDVFERDSQGRVAAHRVLLQLNDGSQREYRTRYWRDDLGRLSAWSLPDGSRLHLRRDDHGQVVALDWQPDGTQWMQPVVQALGRDALGLNRMVLGNGVVAQFKRDSQGRLAAIGHRIARGRARGTALLDHRLAYDAQGRLLSWSRDAQQQRYLYDSVGRLLQAAHRSASAPQQLWRFAYDDNGNRQLAQAPASGDSGERTEAFMRDGNSNRLRHVDASTSVARQVQLWDAAGRLSRNGRWSYRWDADGRLEQVSRDDELVARYRYNHRGQRIARQVGDRVTHHLYDARRRLLAELDEQGGVQRQYIYLADWPVAVLDRLNASQGQGVTDPAVPRGPGFQIRFLHLNHLGAPELVTDLRAQVLWRAHYAPFGGRIQGAGGLSSQGYSLALRLPGQLEDPETGLHNNDHRYYDPDAGRYLSPDPLGADGGSNPYIYVGNSPLTHVDPSGLLLFAFDGTDNGDPPSRQDDWSNVYKLARSYSDGRVWYMNGVGRDDPASGIKTNGLDMLNANTARMRVDYLVAELERFVGASGPAQTTLNVDVIGFSRGAAMARDFSNEVADRIRDGRFAGAGACVRLRFVGLWDTVAQFGANGISNAGWRLSIPPQAAYAAHAVALNEHRTLFPAESIVGSPLAGVRIERGFVGAHADVGGSYAQGDLSDVALVWMHQQASRAGVRMLTLSSEFQRVSSPLLHDSSGGSTDREFRYRNDWGWVYANPMQRVARVEGMQWADTARFIERYPRPLPDVYGEPTLAGEVDVAAYANWLDVNYGLALAGI